MLRHSGRRVEQDDLGSRNEGPAGIGDGSANAAPAGLGEYDGTCAEEKYANRKKIS